MKTQRHPAVRIALVVLWIGNGGLLSAQEISAQPRLQPKWGTQDLGVRTIRGHGFQPQKSDTTFDRGFFSGHLFRTGGYHRFEAIFPDLPAGALITGLELEGCDTSTTNGLLVQLWSRQSPIGPNNFVGQVATGNPETPGCGFFGDPTNLIAEGETVNNFSKTYWLEAALIPTDETNSLGAVRLYYQLQVSPPPATATFGDVPTGHDFFQFVEALADSGITAGCGSGNFCPDAPLTRGQMAVFLSKALGLHFPF